MSEQTMCLLSFALSAIALLASAASIYWTRQTARNARAAAAAEHQTEMVYGFDGSATADALADLGRSMAYAQRYTSWPPPWLRATKPEDVG